MYTVNASFDEGEWLFFGTEQLLYADKGGEVDAVHPESHQSVLVQRHVLLFV